MNARFKDHVDRLEPKFQQLISMQPLTVAQLPRSMPNSGIYLLSEGAAHLYVGRSKRLRERLRYHCADRHFEASFAFLLAREAIGFSTPTYTKKRSRRVLQGDPRFQLAFRKACSRIAVMDVRFVEESDPVRQALLEIYAAISLDTKYNKFETT